MFKIHQKIKSIGKICILLFIIVHPKYKDESIRNAEDNENGYTVHYERNKEMYLFLRKKKYLTNKKERNN